MSRLSRLLPLALAAACAQALPAAAQDLSDIAQVDILPGWRMADGDHMAALRIRLKPGWHTYWRAPGEAGIPPSFDFAGSRNIGRVALHWPAPKVYETGGMTWIGYEDQLILPMEVTPGRADAPIALSAAVDLGVCEDICIPLSVSVSATLPAEATARDASIAAALADRPLSAREAGAGPLDCHVSAGADGLILRAELRLPPMGGPEVAVVETGDAGLWVSPAALTRQGARLSAEVEVLPERPGAPVALDRSRLRLTVLGSRGAVEAMGCD
jgi:DsbC/DsbD-like thiol-disulfide interchange protein